MAGLARAMLALVLAGAVLWLGLPPAASALAGVAISAAGLKGEDVSVSVEAMPPFKLLLLEADAVHIRSGPGSFRGATFDAVDLTLRGLAFGREPGSLDGRARRVTYAEASGATVRADVIELSGAADRPSVRIEIGAADVAAMMSGLWPPELGRVDVLALTTPDGLRITTQLGELTARVAPAADGGLEVLVDGGVLGTLRLTVLSPGPSVPLHFASASVEGGALVLRGTLEARLFGP